MNKIPNIEGLRIGDMVNFLKKHGLEAYLPTTTALKNQTKIERKWISNVCYHLKYYEFMDLVNEARRKARDKNDGYQVQARAIMNLKYPLFRQHSEKIQMESDLTKLVKQAAANRASIESSAEKLNRQTT